MMLFRKCSSEIIKFCLTKTVSRPTCCFLWNTFSSMAFIIKLIYFMFNGIKQVRNVVCMKTYKTPSL